MPAIAMISVAGSCRAQFSMKKVIIITGTPGSGKSMLASLLARKFAFERIDLHRHYGQVSVGYDAKKQCFMVDIKKLVKLVQEKLKVSKNGIVIDSHIAHLIPKKLVSLCVVLVCSDLKLLQRRLRRRGYSKAKVRENLDAEIFQVCLLEAKARGHRIIMWDRARKLSVNQFIHKLSKSL